MSDQNTQNLEQMSVRRGPLTPEQRRRIADVAQGRTPGASRAVVIPGLTTVTKPVAAQTMPGYLDEERTAKHVLFFGTNSKQRDVIHPLAAVLADGRILDQLQKIQDALQFKANAGLNPELVSLEDFDIGVVDTDSDADGANPTYADPGFGLVVEHRSTGRGGYFDLFYPDGYDSGAAFPHGALTTAGAMIELGKKSSRTARSAG